LRPERYGQKCIVCGVPTGSVEKIFSTCLSGRTSRNSTLCKLRSSQRRLCSEGSHRKCQYAIIMGFFTSTAKNLRGRPRRRAFANSGMPPRENITAFMRGSDGRKTHCPNQLPRHDSRRRRTTRERPRQRDPTVRKRRRTSDRTDPHPHRPYRPRFWNNLGAGARNTRRRLFGAGPRRVGETDKHRLNSDKWRDHQKSREQRRRQYYSCARFSGSQTLLKWQLLDHVEATSLL